MEVVGKIWAILAIVLLLLCVIASLLEGQSYQVKPEDKFGKFFDIFILALPCAFAVTAIVLVILM